MSTTNQSHLLFHRSPRRKQIDRFPIESENHIQSIGDVPILEPIVLPPSTIISQRQHDYLYMIYLFILILFYIYYLIILLQDKTNQFDDDEREIPRLLWFKKGYRFN